MNETQSHIKRPPYLMLTILMAGGFIAFLNSTLLNVALPSIMKDFGIATTTVQWLVTIYMLVNGILIPTTAFLIQKYSVRKLFLTAMLLFTIGNLAGGMATVFPVLLVARVVQASGSAIMFPLIMTVLLTSFPVEKRGRAMGLFGLIMVFAPAIGPTLSGWIIEHYEWEMLFHIVTPFAILILLFAFFILKDKKETVKMSLDKTSVVLSSIGFGGLLYGFSSAGSKGWSSPEVYGTLIVGAISLVLFILRQLKLESPMLEFRIYQYPMFALSSVISVILSITMFSAMILLPIYIQTIRGISPLDSGLLMLPGASIMAIMSPITGRLFDKFGARILAIIGLLLTIVTTYEFSQLTLTTAYNSLLIIYTIRMLGLSMIMMPVMTNGLNQLPVRMTSHGTAMNNTLQQVSGAVGSALLVTVMSTRAAAHGKELSASLMNNVTGQPSAGAMAEMKNHIMMQAMVEGLNDAFFVSAIIAIVALILSFFIKRPKREGELKQEKSLA